MVQYTIHPYENSPNTKRRAGAVVLSILSLVNGSRLPAIAREQRDSVSSRRRGRSDYESKPNPSGGFQWSLKAPEANLKGLSGEILGKHGAGPSWTMNDGSSIVGNIPPLKTLVASKGVHWLLVYQ